MAGLNRTPKYMLTCGHLLLFALTFLVFSTFFVFPATSVQSSTLSITSPQNTIYSSKTVDLEWSSGQPLDWCAYSLNGGANNTEICNNQNQFNDTSTSKDFELHNSDSKLGYIKLPKNANIISDTSDQYKTTSRDEIVVGRSGKKIRLTVPTKDGNTVALNMLETQTFGGFKALVDGKKLFLNDTQKDVRITDYSFVSDGKYSNVIQFTSIYSEENIMEFRDIGSGSYLRFPYSDCNSGIAKDQCVEKILVVAGEAVLFEYDGKTHAIKMTSWMSSGSTVKGVFELDGVSYTKGADSILTFDPLVDGRIFFKNITVFSESDGYYPESAEATIIIGPSSCSRFGTNETNCSGLLNIGTTSYSISNINETTESLTIDAYSGADYIGNIPLMTRNGGSVTLVTGESGITYPEGQIKISEIDTIETEPEGTGKIIVINATTYTSFDEINKIIIRENGPSEMTPVESNMNIYAGLTSYGTYVEDNRGSGVLTFWYPDRQISTDASVKPRLNVSGYILGSSYPRNLAIDIGNDDHIDWNSAGELNSSNSPKTIYLNTTTITKFLQKCSSDSEGYCNLPLRFTSDTGGIVRINSLNIRYALNTKITGKEGALNNITLWARDIFGDTYSTTQYFTIESKPPIITINSPENNTLFLGYTTYFNVTTSENTTCTYSYWVSPYPSYPSYTYSGCFGSGGCGFFGGGAGGAGLAPRVMEITGETHHSHLISTNTIVGKYTFVANCTDSAGNSNSSSVTAIYRDKPLTIEIFTPDKNVFYHDQSIKFYLYLTTNHSVDKINLTITKPDNTTETFDEDDFSEYVGAKQFLKQVYMNYNGLKQTGTYKISLYVNDTQGNNDTATRTFRVFDRKNHVVDVSRYSDSLHLHYKYPHTSDMTEEIADVQVSPGYRSNMTLPDAGLDMYLFDRYDPFNVIIPSLNLSDGTQNIFLEAKYINESRILVSPRYSTKAAYAFSIFNGSQMNKTFRVEFDYFRFMNGPTSHIDKVFILKAPYNFTTGSVDYSSAVYYSSGNPDNPLYYDSEAGFVWIYVNDFSVFALLEDKATSEVCADSIDNDYDGQIDEGCTTSGSSSSSSGGGSKSAPPIKRECTTNSNCTITQVCSNYKCINLACSSCEYIEDRSCKKYQCCKDSECNTGELCKDHSCMKIVEETAISITEEQILADNAIDSARKAITSATGRKDTKDAEEFLGKAIAARNNNDYANAKALAEKSRLSLESAPMIQGKAIESTAERPDLLLIALVAILIVLIIMVLFPKKKSAVSGSKKHQ